MCSFIHTIIYSSFLLYPGLYFQSEFQSSSVRDRNMMLFLLESPLVTSRSTQIKPPYITSVSYVFLLCGPVLNIVWPPVMKTLCLSLRCSDSWTWETREWQWWRDGTGAWDKRKDLPFLSSVTHCIVLLIARLTSAARCYGNTAAALESWVGEAGGCYLVNTFTFLHWI